jgi:hypothetical protein
MRPESFALAVAVMMFVGGLLGLVLQRALPEHHTTGSSRDMIGAIVGLLTLLAAGSIVGSFVGGRLLGLVPFPVLLPLLAVILVLSAWCYRAISYLRNS